MNSLMITLMKYQSWWNIKREIKNEFSFNSIKESLSIEVNIYSHLLDNFKIKICLKDP